MRDRDARVATLLQEKQRVEDEAQQRLSQVR